MIKLQGETHDLFYKTQVLKKLKWAKILYVFQGLRASYSVICSILLIFLEYKSNYGKHSLVRQNNSSDC